MGSDRCILAFPKVLPARRVSNSGLPTGREMGMQVLLIIQTNLAANNPKPGAHACMLSGFKMRSSWNFFTAMKQDL